MPKDMQRVNLISNKGERIFYYHADEYRLGSGAMGDVYKGQMQNNPERKVAIKRVHTCHAVHPGIRERARHESSLSFDHPNVIKMLGYSEPELNRGPIYILSEFVSGNTIDQFVKSLAPGMRTEIVSRMMCSVLDGLTCLHRQKIWHRDIKPSNIMVEDGRLVKVTDLGIAKSDGKSHGTLTGYAIGTFAYAAPEQLCGRQDEVSHLSDIYSAGITFYELLTGVNPIESDNYVETMERQMSMALPYDPRIPKPLYRVILKATAKNPLARYQSATEFKSDIENPPGWWLYYMRYGFTRRSYGR